MADEVTTELTTEIQTPVENLKISDDDFNAGKIQALADRPNASSTLGVGGLSASDLKAKFDANPSLIRTRFNELIDYITNGAASAELKVKSGDTTISLSDLLKYILDGTLASTYLKAKENSASETPELLNAILNKLSTSKLDANGLEWDSDGGLNAYLKTIRVKDVLAGTDTKFASLEDEKIVIFDGTDENDQKAKFIYFPEPTADSAEETLATEEWVKDKINGAEWGSVQIGFLADNKKKVLILPTNTSNLGFSQTGAIQGDVISIEKNKNGADYLLELSPSGIKQYIKSGDGYISTAEGLTFPITYGSSNPKNHTLATEDWVENNISDIAEEALAETKADVADVTERVNKLEGMLINYTEDETVAYEKPVHEDSAPKAILHSIGGASQVGMVIIDKNVTTTGTIDLGTLEAGSYSVKLTLVSYDGEGAVSALDIIKATGESGEVYEFETDTQEGQFVLPEKCSVTYIFNDFPLNSAVFNVLLENKGIHSAPTTAIVTEGKNLIPFPYLDAMGVGYTREVNGITWTVNYDRSVTANGTASANSVLSLVSLTDKSEFEGRIAFSGLPEEGEWNKTFWMGINGTKANGEPLNGAAQKPTPYTADIVKGDLLVQLAIAKGYTANNLTFYPKMQYVDDIITYNLDALLALDGYGEANPLNPNEYNEVDIANGLYYHRGDLVGNLWQPFSEKPENISHLLVDLKQGKDYFFIDVQGGGTVRFENDKKMAVPSKITFAEV